MQVRNGIANSGMGAIASLLKRNCLRGAARRRITGGSGLAAAQLSNNDTPTGGSGLGCKHDGVDVAAVSLSRSAGIPQRVILAVQLGGVGTEKLVGAGLGRRASPAPTPQPVVAETSRLAFYYCCYSPTSLCAYSLQHYS
jgi:hypothetical protein